MDKIKINDLLNYKFLGNLSKNKEETHFAYTLSKANLQDNNYQSELYVHDGKEARKALDLNTSRSFYWESDHTILVPFTKTDEEKDATKELKTVLYRYDLNRKTFEYADTLYVPTFDITPLQDGRWLILTSLHEDAHIIYEDPANRNQYINQTKDYSDYEIIETIPFYSDGGTFTRNQNLQTLIYDPIEKTYLRLFDKNMQIRFVSYQEDINRIFFLSKASTGISDFYFDVYEYNVADAQLELLFKNDTLSISNVFQLNDTTYLFGSDMKDHGINQNGNFYTLKEGEASFHLPFGKSAYNSTGSDMRLTGSKTNHIIDNVYYFVGTYQDRTVLYQFDGELKTIYQPKGSIDGWIKFNDKFLGIGLFDNKLQELYQFDLENNTYTQSSHHNDKALENKYIADPIYHTFTNSETTLDGWVLLPKDYDENKSYPAILDIHGGPKTIYNENFFHEMQVWVNEGYIVFYCNPRGGDSYEDDFADIRGQYGGVDYEDIMTFTDFVLENYAVDENRMGVTGGSYGGFMTNWIVSHTDRFKAAATQRSISNWISFYGTSDIGYYFGPDQTDADPLDDFEKAWEQSPLKHAKNIKTPLLFIHSDQDYRCPIEQAMQLYTVVKKQGVDTRFVWFKNENHNLSRGGKPKSRIKRLTEITDWMNQYLK